MTKLVSRKDVRPIQHTTGDPIIVTRQGVIARLESSLTPHEAQIEDLVFLRKALKRARVPFLLIRDDNN